MTATPRLFFNRQQLQNNYQNLTWLILKTTENHIVVHTSKLSSQRNCWSRARTFWHGKHWFNVDWHKAVNLRGKWRCPNHYASQSFSFVSDQPHQKLVLVTEDVQDSYHSLQGKMLLALSYYMKQAHATSSVCPCDNAVTYKNTWLTTV